MMVGIGIPYYIGKYKTPEQILGEHNYTCVAIGYVC